MVPLDIECLLVFNDDSHDAIELLRTHTEPAVAAIKVETPQLHLQVQYLSKPFEAAYSEIKQLLERGRYRNVLFNLGQCGHSNVELSTLVNILDSFVSAEVFYTFAIKSLIAFLRKANPTFLERQLGLLGINPGDLAALDPLMSNQTWLGTAERMVFESFRASASYVSPFSINNPDGWRYWFIHFANSYRARQEYNDVLHNNSSAQAHFGRSGLNMLSYDPNDDKRSLYLFDVSGRVAAKAQLSKDIPRLLSDFGDTIPVGEFYENIYNMTPAHMDDIHSAIIDNPDLQVVTKTGGERRKPNTISADDILRLKKQRSFFPIFLGDQSK
jgi:three-Cys-motif partner protein